jgi:hypothetical protein
MDISFNCRCKVLLRVRGAAPIAEPGSVRLFQLFAFYTADEYQSKHDVAFSNKNTSRWTMAKIRDTHLFGNTPFHVYIQKRFRLLKKLNGTRKRIAQFRQFERHVDTPFHFRHPQAFTRHLPSTRRFNNSLHLSTNPLALLIYQRGIVVEGSVLRLFPFAHKLTCIFV